ncbi:MULTISPECIES: DUF460 domain-containing protein [unclassified Methanopyrus]|uniref:DUF460 domain-containing protein n=1 Tax=Methanopyrus sp. SNP6 TaxID=1937005 RepID=UPI0011E5C860|nr:DUF460 domain-containing protein [Methanopyrus sp. SNP6]
MIVVGIDIVRSKPPEYAVAILEDGEEVLKRRLSKRELFDLILSLKPDVVAVDDVYELLNGASELLELVKSHPELKLVQVTGKPGNQRSLQRLAREHGLPTPDPRNPEEEALTCARLAELGVGVEAFVLEDETRVRIGRLRRPGQGGYSQSRYARNLHAAVKRATRELQRLLEAEGMEYDLRVRKAEGGYASAEFTVYDRYDRVKPVVNKVDAREIKIDVEPVLRDRITFRDTSHRRELLTIGVDPGTTTALAVLNADGEVVHLESSRELSFSELTERIESLGRPAVVATDVTPVPQTVRRLARSLGARLYVPDRRLSVDEKRELVKGHLARQDQNVRPRDTHQRDALAAAVKAYHAIVKPALRKVEHKASEEIKRRDILRAASYVIKGLPVVDALRIVEEERQVERERREEREKIHRYRERIASLKKELRAYEKKVEKYEHEIEHLERLVERLKRENEELQRKLDRMRDRIEELVEEKIGRKLEAKEREIELLRRELIREKSRRERLERELRRAERLNAILRSGKGIPVVEVEKASHDALSELETPPVFVLYVEDPSGMSESNVRELSDLSPEAVIVPEDASIPEHALEEFRRLDLPLLREGEDVTVRRAGTLALVESDELRRAVRRARKRWEEREREREKERILRCIEEYQRRRRGKFIR